MSDIVKVVFDGDLSPLQQKQALAKTELNTFVAESESEIKGIASAGEVIGASAQKGAEQFSRYYKPVINDLARDIKAISGGFEKVLGAEESKAARAGLEDLDYELKKLNIDGYEAAASSQVLKTELSSITKQLAAYQFELASASQANIFFAETEVAAAAAGKAEGGGLNLGARPLQGYGGIFRATGLTNAGVNEVEANAALNIISKLGISVSSLVVVGGVAALGAAAIAVSSKLNEEAEKRLESEENISRAINKQVIGLRESLNDYQRIKDQLQQTETLHKNIAQLVGQTDQAGVKALRDKTDQDNLATVGEVNRLQAQVAQNERELAFEKARKPDSALSRGLFGGELTPAQQRQNVGEAETRLEKTKKQLAEAEDTLRKGTDSLKELDKASTDITASQDKRFASNFENFAKAEAQKREFAERQAEKFAASVKAGNEEADRLVKGYKEEFDRLFLDVNKDNPFATQAIQSSKALETLEDKLKGVGSELRKQALDLQRTASAQQVYNLQLNSGLQAIDLRSQADRFRNPTQKELQTRLNEQMAEFQRTSNSTNPDVFYDFQREQQRIADFNKRQTQDTLDKKLDLTDRAKTEEQKAAADTAVVSFAGGLNPDDLTKSERAKIADALERSAARTESRQQRSLAIQADLLATLQSIDKRGEKLTGIVAEKGKEGLDATITVRDETDNGVGKDIRPKRPTQEDVRATYGPYGSSGGLTSF